MQNTTPPLHIIIALKCPGHLIKHFKKSFNKYLLRICYEHRVEKN